MELWRPVVGYEEFYEVSSLGRIRSFDRRVGWRDGHTRVRKGTLLKPIVQGNDYWKIDLTDVTGRKKRKKIHHLVAEAFLGIRPDERLLVLHEDDNKAHNGIGNLYYGTRSDNQRDSVRNGKHRSNTPKGEKHWGSKLKEVDIPQIIELHRRGVPIMQIAARFGVTDMPIHDVLKGRTWKWLTGLEASC